MFRRLSVLPILLVIFVVIFSYCGSSLYAGSPQSPTIGSPTVPASTYNKNLFDSPSSKYDARQNFRGPGRYNSRYFHGASPDNSNAGSGSSSSQRALLFRRPLTYDRSARLEPYYNPYRSKGLFDRKADTSLSSPLGGALGGYSLPSIDGKFYTQHYRRSSQQGTQSSDLGAFEGPVTLDELEIARRTENQARRRRMIDEEFLFSSGVYLSKERSISQEAKSDSWLTKQVFKGLKFSNDPHIDIMPATEYERYKMSLDIKNLQKKLDDETNSQEKLLEDESLAPDDNNSQAKESEKAEKPELAKRPAGKQTEEKNTEENKLLKTENNNPLADVTPSNVESRLEKSREALVRFKKFQHESNLRYLSYIEKADKLLAGRKYESAADAYQVAGIWKDHWGSHAGTAIARMALGQFNTSATHLIRAFETAESYKVQKSDIGKLIGSSKLYRRRLVSLESMCETGKNSKAAFLLAYLYTLEGDYKKATRQLESAKPDLGNTKAWKMLNKAITDQLAAD